MAIDPNDEILQDFLIEAGELLENLNEQLVELEHRPDDPDLLNAVFRSFHTIKGGAGFLNLDSLVAVCHRAEDVFNRLRNREIGVTPQLMDVVLRVLDVVNVMFGELRSGEMPNPAPSELLDGLQYYVTATAETLATRPTAASTEHSPQDIGTNAESSDRWAENSMDSASAGGLDEADAAMLAMFGEQANSAPVQDVDLGTGSPPAGPRGEPEDDDISDEEFEALLDALHGSKTAPKTVSSESQQAGSGAPTASGSDIDSAPANSDEISDEEFEALLDRLHGPGKSPVASSKPQPNSSSDTSAGVDAKPKDTRPAPAPQAGARKGESSSASPASTPPLTPQHGNQSDSSGPSTSIGATRTPGPAPESTVRVDTVRLDQIMNLVGELVLVRNRMLMLKGSAGDDEFGKAVNALALVTSDLQSAVMKTRMQPIKKVFGRFPRVVRDLARNLGKQVDLEIRGEDTDLDKNLVEALADPLVHLVRNAVDHGIEDPVTRRAAGKAEAGRVLLSAEQEGDHISLIISDDGRGMDPDVLRAKAVEKGLMDAAMAERLTDREAFNLIFHAGFSTKTEISDVSGRGVGMDVVKTKIAQLNGRIEIESVIGGGTTLRIKLPLTLAILPALMVVIAGRRYALPLASVAEILDLDLRRTNFVDDREVVVVRGHALPVHYLRRWVRPDMAPEPSQFAHVVVVQVAERRAGLVVDDLIGQEEVVIKPLGAGVQKVPGLAGATITGDGGIALIFDVSGVLNLLSKLPPLAHRAKARV